MQKSLQTPNPAFNQSRSGLFGLKTILTFFIVLEAVTATILFAVYLYFFDTIVQNLGPNQAEAKAIAAFILGIVVYLLWKTFVSVYLTLDFIRKNDYPTISANRYIFAALSLSLGGLWTPFILTSLPNTNVQSTINPRYFLTKSFGLISGFGSLISLFVYFLALKVGTTSLTNSVIFQNGSLTQSLTLSILVLALAVSIFGFFSLYIGCKAVKSNLGANQDSAIFKIVSTIWLGIISCELFLVLVYTIVRFVGVVTSLMNAMGQARNNSSGLVLNFLMFPLFMMRILFQLLYTIWTIYVIFQTIQGLWAPQVSYKTFESLARYSERKTQTLPN